MLEQAGVDPGAVAFALDLGGADWNGTARSWFPAARWHALDLQVHAGQVDPRLEAVIEADAATWRSPDRYDLVLCTEVLEHAERWRDIVSTAWWHLRPGGLLIVTCAGPSRRPHGASGAPEPAPGEHYQGVSAAALAEQLRACFGPSDRSAYVEVGPSGGIADADTYAWARRADGVAPAPALAAAGEPRIVLCMIAGNEERIIERCLRAALPHVDGWVICTNGTDGTHDIVDRIAVAARPGLLARHAWSDFGSNRTAAVEAASRWVADQAASSGWDPATTYLLILDADMILHVDPTFRRAALCEPHYEIDAIGGAAAGQRARLLRLSHRWRCLGVVRERWGANRGAPPRRLDGVRIAVMKGVHAREDRLARNIRLLARGVEEEPGNVRYMLDLAEAYFESGQNESAIYWYARREEAGGHEEECWYCQVRQGVARLRLGQTELGAGVLLAAYERRPTRAEPLVALARHYRERGQNRVAFMLAQQAATIAFPAADSVGVERETYRSAALEEIAITAFYNGRRDEGLRACEALLAQRDHGDDFYAYVARNELYYLAPELACVRRGAFPPPVTAGAEPDWREAVDRSLRREGAPHTTAVPWSRDDQRHVIRSFDPLVVVDEASGREIVRWTPPWNGTRWRAATAPVALPGGGRWLALVREAAHGGPGPVFLHRWIELGVEAAPRWSARITRFSPPFSFESHGAEQAQALALHEGRLVVVYTRDDGQARFVELEPGAVEGQLG